MSRIAAAGTVALALGLGALGGPGGLLVALAGTGFLGFAWWLAAQRGLGGEAGPGGPPHGDDAGDDGAGD